MRATTIIHRYIFRELISPFTISLLFLTFIFIMVRIPDIINMVVNYDTGLSTVFLLISFFLPRVLEFAIPMSVMIAVLLTFMRMSGDNEIIALKGGGVTIYRLLPPVILFTLACTAISVVVTVYGIPWGNLSIKKTSIEMARSSMNVALKERSFNTDVDNLMIYVSSIDIPTGELRDVFIEDSRTPGQIIVSVAPKGVILGDSGTDIYTLRLFQGKVNQVSLEKQQVNSVDFDRYDINLDFGAGRGGAAGAVSKDLDEMSLGELLQVARTPGAPLKQINSALMELHEKFSLPAACLVLGVLSMALGLQAGSSRRSSGFGLGLFFILLYYLLLAGSWSVGETGGVPPGVGMWFPDIVMGICGGYLLVRIAREQPVTLPGPVRQAVSSLKKRVLPKAG